MGFSIWRLLGMQPGNSEQPAAATAKAPPADAPARKPPRMNSSADGGVSLRHQPVRAREREAALRGAAQKAIGVVERQKDVSSDKAMAGFGEGDPRATARRNALTVLLAAKTGELVDVDKLRGISKEVAKDISYLQAEAAEYSATGSGQFKWNEAKRHDLVISPAELQREFDTRVAEQRKLAEEFVSGKRPYMDVSSTSVIGLSLIADRDLRARGLVDALWQFRARVDQAKQKEGAGNRDRIRIDRSGIALVAEQRALLASAEFEAGEVGTREYALVREVIASHPISSTNSIFEARNAISALLTDQGRYQRDAPGNPLRWVIEPDSVPPGATTAPYRAIHWNYSRDTPRDIEAFISEWLFPLGPKPARGNTFCALVDAMNEARSGNCARARETLKTIPQGAAAEVAALLGRLDVADAKLADAIRDELAAICTQPLGKNVEANLDCAARVYRAICSDQPDANWLENNLLRAREAREPVANVLVSLRRGDEIGTLRELGVARLAVRDAIVGTRLGTERQDLIRFDAQLARMANEELGAAVERVGNLSTPEERGRALVAVQTALRCAVASGLHALRDGDDSRAALGTPLPAVLARVDDLVARVEAKASPPLDEYRAVMSEAHRSVTRAVQNVRAFFQVRQRAVATSGADLDGEFIDQFIKQSPLHYATALTEKSMRAGLVAKIGPRCIENIEGMRVLNSVGPVVFSGVVVGESTKDILETEHPRDALAVVYRLDEKKMVAGIGGLLVDTENAPGGNSHLNMYAMNNGIPVVALPELRSAYVELLANAGKEGGLYVDDSDGSFRMMTVQYALERGIIKADRNKPDEVKAALESLRPGNNRDIKYLKPTSDGEGFELLERHRAEIAPSRLWREVEIYVPADEVKGVGRECVAFRDLAKLGVHARHIAGEKGTVLALLKTHAKLGKYVPDGSVVGTGRIRRVLSEINISRGELEAALGSEVVNAWQATSGLSLAEAWDCVWKRDPRVGSITEDSFKASGLYTDGAYRKRVREGLQRLTLAGVTRHLVATDANGNEQLTADGQALYAELLRNRSTATAPRPGEGLGDSWIFRSSFTGEDRPGKSGAGQYESLVDMKIAKQLVADGKAASIAEALPVARMKAFAGVLESTWMPEPVENNVSEQFFLRHIYPSATVQSCLSQPQFSGVAISRDTATGGPGVSLQLVPGFGGGVEGGKTTEVVLSRSGYRVSLVNGEPAQQDATTGTVRVGPHEVPSSVVQELHGIITEVETFFDEVVEKGKGHAVDVELAYDAGQWWIVQARVIILDR